MAAMTGQIITAFLVAAGLGAVVGTERQLRASDGGDITAGVRTFALYGLWGAAAGFAGDEWGGAGFAVALAAFAALIVASYWLSSQATGDWGTTTEAAALVVFGAGTLVWADHVVAAVAVAVGVAALLRLKGWFHRAVEKFSQDDLSAALQFGVITAVVLPLVPDEDIGPFDAINLRQIWLMVVFVSAIGLAGYVALRLMGTRGLGPTGLIGGLVSSTAVTLGFSKMSKEQPPLRTALVAGVLGASGLMYARVLVEAYVVAPSVGRVVLVPLVLLFLAVEGIAVWYWRRPIDDDHVGTGFEVKNPLTLTSALQFGALYGVIIFISKALLETTNEASLNIVGAVSGINDVDAITLSTANLVRDGLDPNLGARVIIIAATVNTVVKGGMALVLGSRRMGRAVMTVLGAAAIAGLVVWFFI